MAIALTEKYAAQVDELLALETQTAPVAKTDGYSWDGAQTIYIKSVGTVALNTYGRNETGLSRYGTPGELEVTKKPYALTQDKSFTFTIDKMNSEETQVLEAASALARQIKYVIVPELDDYRIKKMAGTTGIQSKTETITSVADSLMAAKTALTNKKVPLTGRIAYVGASFTAKLIKEIEMTNSTGEMAAVNGVIGRYAGFDIIEVPDDFLPAKCNFIALHTMAVVSPVKLAEYKIHMDPPGLSGALVEGRLYHDCFVIENKKACIYKSVTA